MALGNPVKRPLPVRLVLTLGLCFLYAWRWLRLPSWVHIPLARRILDNWTEPMLSVLIRSRIQRAFIDQTCSLKRPAECVPRVETEEPYRLSPKDVASFYDNGYLPPFRAFDEDEIRAVGEEILEARERRSSVYGFVTDRDRHLEMPRMLEMIRRPAIVERCAQLLGPDLTCWRSQFFFKPPRGEAVQWHQASTYMVEDGFRPALVPPDRDELFQLTVWVAVDPATHANGCLRFIPGTADAIRTVTFGGGKGFYHSRYTLDYDCENAPVAAIEAKPGEAIIFSERTIHGSAANTTDHSRSAFNFRVIRPDTQVYPGKTEHRANHMNEVYPLDRWGCVLLRGEDRQGLNPIADSR